MHYWASSPSIRAVSLKWSTKLYDNSPEEKKHNQQKQGTKGNLPFKEAKIHFTRLLRVNFLTFSKSTVGYFCLKRDLLLFYTSPRKSYLWGPKASLSTSVYRLKSKNMEINNFKQRFRYTSLGHIQKQPKFPEIILIWRRSWLINDFTGRALQGYCTSFLNVRAMFRQQ